MSGETTPWRLTINQPRWAQGERSLYARARRLVGGREQEQRISLGTMDPAEAELERARVEAEMNTPAMTLVGLLDGRVAALSSDPGTSPDTLDGYRSARARLLPLDVPVAGVDRAALLRLRDAIRAAAPNISTETINGYFRRAGAAWHWAEERGLVDRPWPKIKPLPKPPRRKRPFTPVEAVAVLEWVARWQGGWARGVLGLVDDTGRRSGEVCKLKERDLNRRELTVRVRQKGGRVLELPVTAETMAAIPARSSPDAWLFPRPKRGGGVGPARRDVVRGIVRRAIRALKIPDGHRLDVHSFRRAFASHAHRAGVPDDVTRRLGGWESHPMLAHYQRETVGDDLRAAQTRVREWRAEQVASSPASSPASLEKRRVSHGQKGARTPDPALVRTASRTRQVDAGHLLSALAPREEQAKPHRPARPFSLGADPELALLSRWVDECPSAFRRLRDPEVFAHFMAAAEAVVPEAARKERRRVQG